VADRASDLILSVLADVEPLMQAAFDAVGGAPEPGSALDQVFLLDGRKVVVDYLQHGEPGLALEHLVYMITEPGLTIGHDTHRRLLEAGNALSYPASTFDDIAVG
jgi:hypothetical protein